VNHPSAAGRPARLTVGVVGAGRVGPALAAALALAGHRPVAASGVSDASRRRAADLLPGVPLVDPAEVLARAELVLLTVPDDVLPDLVAGLAATGAVRPGQLLAHTSGRYGTGVLEPARQAGGLPLALHPVMTFTGSSVDVQRLAGCSFGVTAPEELRMAAVRSSSMDWAPTTWSPWSPSPWSCCAPPGWAPRTGCSGRCSAPRWTTPCAPVTPR
jgi:predicted short-subunit dehydrogenase-like oxidoreductase (DUF2520 family)